MIAAVGRTPAIRPASTLHPTSFFNRRPPVVHIQVLPSSCTPPRTPILQAPLSHHHRRSASAFLPLIPPGMWLWLRRGCPVCALPEQPLQGGPQPAEVQALPRLCAHQPRAEGELLHHQQRRVRRLSLRVRGAKASSRFSPFSFCLCEPLRKDTKRTHLCGV